MDLSITVIGAAATAQRFTIASTTIDTRLRKQVRQWGHTLERRVKGRASGRPGPRTITGDYRRSINTRMTGNAFFSAAIVGTASPQGRRLEYGFVGVDSLGRRYHQPPFPHFRPASAQTEPEFVKAIGQEAVRI